MDIYMYDAACRLRYCYVHVNDSRFINITTLFGCYLTC